MRLVKEYEAGDYVLVPCRVTAIDGYSGRNGALVSLVQPGGGYFRCPRDFIEDHISARHPAAILTATLDDGSEVTGTIYARNRDHVWLDRGLSFPPVTVRENQVHEPDYVTMWDRKPTTSSEAWTLSKCSEAHSLLLDLKEYMGKQAYDPDPETVALWKRLKGFVEAQEGADNA